MWCLQVPSQGASRGSPPRAHGVSLCLQLLCPRGQIHFPEVSCFILDLHDKSNRSLDTFWNWRALGEFVGNWEKWGGKTTSLCLPHVFPALCMLREDCHCLVRVCLHTELFHASWVPRRHLFCQVEQQKANEVMIKFPRSYFSLLARSLVGQLDAQLNGAWLLLSLRDVQDLFSPDNNVLSCRWITQ